MSLACAGRRKDKNKNLKFCKKNSAKLNGYEKQYFEKFTRIF